MESNLATIRRWLEGKRPVRLTFAAQWKIFLIRIGDRAYDLVDEKGSPINPSKKRPYSYDLALIAEEDDISIGMRDLERVASHLEKNNWAVLTQRSPLRLGLTVEGMEKAEGLINDALNPRTKRRIRAPAADRYVRLDDNSQSYQAAVGQLEELIRNASDIRVNDWPEKEGILASLNAALGMLRTKYVNKNTIIATVSSATTFILLKFVDAPIAELAANTWKAVKSLF